MVVGRLRQFKPYVIEQQRSVNQVTFVLVRAGNNQGVVENGKTSGQRNQSSPVLLRNSLLVGAGSTPTIHFCCAHSGFCYVERIFFVIKQMTDSTQSYSWPVDPSFVARTLAVLYSSVSLLTAVVRLYCCSQNYMYCLLSSEHRGRTVHLYKYNCL